MLLSWMQFTPDARKRLMIRMRRYAEKQQNARRTWHNRNNLGKVEGLGGAFSFSRRFVPTGPAPILPFVLLSTIMPDCR